MIFLVYKTEGMRAMEFLTASFLFSSLWCSYFAIYSRSNNILLHNIHAMVAFTFAAITAAVALFAQSAVAVPSPAVDANGIYVKRGASCTFPTASKTVSLSAPKTITGTFDGEPLDICAVN
jgi:hypothetical protein